ncbi:hypothetical protein ACYF6T_05205 [Streptomyces sp. 7R007]
MSRHRKHESGAYGAYSATREAEDPPNVYHPLPESVPYEGYADPAAAHGWQNAYDETAELPVAAEAHPGRAGRRRRRGPLGRRVAIAVGALGVLSVGVVVAGPFDSSSSGGPHSGVRGQQDGASRQDGTSGASTPAPGDTTASGASASGPSDGASAPGPDTARSSAPTATKSGAAGGGATPAPTTAPATPAPADTAPGNSGSKPGKGHGSGATKGPG